MRRLVFVLLAGCASPSPAPAPAPLPPPPAKVEVENHDDGVMLSIPPRNHAAEAPPEGWCGETTIQEALLHYGVWAPQRAINRAGKPSHPDLYSPDIPVALRELGVRFHMYSAPAKDYAAFAKWVKSAVDEGAPVIAGVKILPTKHPEWGLDHFVLVVGYGERGLLVNTTWGHREWVSDTTTPGLSFKNAFYAIRLDGVREAGARLTVLEESDGKVKLRVTCGDREREETIDAEKPARFQC